MTSSIDDIEHTFLAGHEVLVCHNHKVGGLAIVLLMGLSFAATALENIPRDESDTVMMPAVAKFIGWKVSEKFGRLLNSLTS